jgi:hypothetical protein
MNVDIFAFVAEAQQAIGISRAEDWTLLKQIFVGIGRSISWTA